MPPTNNAAPPAPSADIFAGAEKTLERILRAVAVGGGLGLAVAIVVTCLSIVGKLCRRFLNAALGADFNPPVLAWLNPILGEEELVQYAVGFALFAALPLLTLRRGHITVNLLRNFFSAKMNRVLDLLGYLIFAAVAYMMTTQQWFLIFKKTRAGQESLPALLFGGEWTEFAARLRAGDESQILGLPLWPIYAVAEFCVILLFVACAFCVIRGLREWRAAER